MEAQLARKTRKRATASATVRAGGEETREKLPRAYGRTVTGGLYTSRGPTLEEHGIEYKSFNEDAAVLGVIPASRGKRKKELVFAGAFDQAGGMGQIPGRTGAASKLVADAVADAARAVAAGGAPLDLLQQAAAACHAGINALNIANGVEAVTTATFGLILDGLLVSLNCGDSKTYHFDAAGALRNETRSHNLCDETAARVKDPNAGLQFSNIITASLGGEGTPEIDRYTWEVSPGDVLLFVSDGVADANLEAQRTAAIAQCPWTVHNAEVTVEQLGEQVRLGGEGWEIAERISNWALRKMVCGDAKPDNVACVALRMY